MVLALLLVLAPSPIYDAFDGPLDPRLWYVGVPDQPSRGALKVPKGGWLASRGIPDETIERLEVVFRQRGGRLEVSFHDAKEPLTSPLGDPFLAPTGQGERTLVIERGAAKLDGERLVFDGPLRGTFRLGAARGAVELLEVRVSPRVSPPPLPSGGVFIASPPIYRDGDDVYTRTSMLLWDVEVTFLSRRGDSGCRPLQAPPRGSPVLGALVGIGNGEALAKRCGGHALARADWGDEKANLTPERYEAYLASEYAVFDVLMRAQEALNLALPPRRADKALVHLAVIRHSENTHAAVALAETQKALGALAALTKALDGERDYRRVPPDRLRRAAGEAARAILGEPPAEWPGFAFEPQSRFVTMDRARELAR